MSKLIVTEFLTLDGVMEAPGGEPGHPHSGWVFDHFTDEQGAYKFREVLAAGSQLIGRVTYESFLGAWPAREGEFADRMNSMPKYVVSSSLQSAEWENTKVIALEDVPALKADSAEPVLVPGSRTLVQALLARGWVDELRLMIFPVILGSGARLFPSSEEKRSLRLTHHETFSSGVAVHHYVPA